MKGVHSSWLADEPVRSGPQRPRFEAGWPNPFVVMFGNNPAAASLFDGPDFPWDRVAGLGCIPVPMKFVSGRQHVWAHCSVGKLVEEP